MTAKGHLLQYWAKSSQIVVDLAGCSAAWYTKCISNIHFLEQAMEQGYCITLTKKHLTKLKTKSLESK